MLLAELDAVESQERIVANSKRYISKTAVVAESTVPSCSDAGSVRVAGANAQMNAMAKGRHTSKSPAAFMNAMQHWKMRRAVEITENPAFHAADPDRYTQHDFTLAMEVCFGKDGTGPIGTLETDGDEEYFSAAASPWEMGHKEFAVLNLTPDWLHGIRERIAKHDRFASHPRTILTPAKRTPPPIPRSLAWLAKEVKRQHPTLTRESEESEGTRILHGEAFPNHAYFHNKATATEAQNFVNALKDELLYFEVELVPIDQEEFIVCAYMGFSSAPVPAESAGKPRRKSQGRRKPRKAQTEWW
jgi:hypothetical protein